MHSPAPVTLKGKALQLLAARDYSRAELERKLRHWQQQRKARMPAQALPGLMTGAALLARQTHGDVPAAALQAEGAPDEKDEQAHAASVARVLDELEAKGYLSDTRAAQALVHRRASQLGTSRIVQELRRKGLDADVVEQAADTLAGTELERAREVWRKKFGVVANTPAERARQMRFLASRGFQADTVYHIVQGRDTD